MAFNPAQHHSQDTTSESQLLPPRPQPGPRPQHSSSGTRHATDDNDDNNDNNDNDNDHNDNGNDPKNSNPVSSSSSSPAPSPPSQEEEEETQQQQQPDLPLSMSTSLLLHGSTAAALPQSARTALARANASLDPPEQKVQVRFHAVGGAPQLRQRVFKISASSRFGSVVSFLRRRLGVAATTSGTVGAPPGLFCYVNSVFAPGLDEGVGNLWRCFKTDDVLVVAYSLTPAFG